MAIYDLANENTGDDFGITQINLKQCASALGIAKAVGQIAAKGENTYDVPYTIVVQNYGSDPQPVRNIQVVDNLETVFARAVSFSVVGLSSSQFTVNPAYNGRNDTHLLTGDNTLASGARATIELVVRVRIGPNVADKGPYNNSATVTGLSGNVQIEDDSVNGEISDIDGDGDPKDPSEGSSTPVVIGGVVFVPIAAKR